MTVPEAMKVLTQALRDDPGYRIGWQANIAMKFVDECESSGLTELVADRATVHAIANEAADSFLKLLCYQPKQES